MKFFFFIVVFSILSCNPNPDKGKDSLSKINTTNSNPDTVKQHIIEKEHNSTHITPLETSLNEDLRKVYGKDWHILNDQKSKWTKDVFDYFIAPNRKNNPNYPYITRGDFNGDNKPDIAAVVSDTTIKNFRIAIFLGQYQIKLWEEDIMIDAALSTMPKSTIEGMNGEKTKKIKLNGDGINVEYFEKASFVLYWNNSSFKRIQTGD